MDSFKTYLCKEKEIHYTGSQLAPHWIYGEFGKLGNTLVAFVGRATVSTDHMVDLEDVIKNAPIYSPKMLHFIGEWFIDSLDMGILLQHAIVAQAYELLLESGLTELTRKGNDIFYKERKVSVSIATKTPVSVLIHFGVNIDTEGAPVPAAGLSEMDISPTQFAEQLMERFKRDYDGWRKARVKVIPR